MSHSDTGQATPDFLLSELGDDFGHGQTTKARFEVQPIAATDVEPDN